MWRCHKCAKPVYFAERKQSLGYDWHPECLRCEECGKRLNPGQHAEHKGVPYCHVPCYGALFGPQLFGHGTRVEAHKSFGQKGSPKPVAHNSPTVSRSYLETKLKTFNQYFDGKSGEIRSREVNGRLILEGALRIHWGVKGVIHLKENDDQRTVVTVRKRNSCRFTSGRDSSASGDENVTTPPKSVNSTRIQSASSVDTGICVDQFDRITLENESNSRCSADSGHLSTDSISITPTPPHSPAIKPSATLPSKLEAKQMELDELDQLLIVERHVVDTDKLYQTMPTVLPSQSSIDSSSESPSPSISQSESKSENLNTTEMSTLDSTQDIKTISDSEMPFDTCQDTMKEIPVDAPSTISPEQDTEDSYDESTLKATVDVDLLKLLNRNKIMPVNKKELMSRSFNDDTLKANSPIDPKKINDSLKLYDEMVKSTGNIDNFSINFEKKLEDFSSDDIYLNDDYDEGTLKKSQSVDTMIQNKAKQQMLQNDLSAYNRAFSINSDGIDGFKNEDGVNYSLTRSISGPEQFIRDNDEDSESDNEPINYAHPVDDEIIIPNEGAVVIRRVHNSKSGSTAIKRRNNRKRQKAIALKRRCSINGHYYNRETSFFTPPYGSQMSVWVTSLVSTKEVINLMLDKYKVDANAQRFALFVIRDNGEQRKLKDDEYPLLVRVTLGPHEDISRLFLMDADKTGEVSSAVAQFINLSIAECESILQMYSKEEEREANRIREKYSELRLRIKQRMEELKVRL